MRPRMSACSSGVGKLDSIEAFLLRSRRVPLAPYGGLCLWLPPGFVFFFATNFRDSLAPTMKLIIAIIQPSKLEDVKTALTEVEVFRLTVMDCQGFGRQKGQTELYRGHEYKVNLLRKVQLQIAVNDDFVEPTIDAIIKGGRTGEKGQIGDGKIFVLPMDDCVRIRTGERGSEAI